MSDDEVVDRWLARVMRDRQPVPPPLSFEEVLAGNSPIDDSQEQE